MMKRIFLLLALLPLLAAVAPQAGASNIHTDINGDGTVDVSDLNLIINEILASTATHDLNGDGAVDVSEMNLVINAILHLEPEMPLTTTYTVNGVSFTMVSVSGGTFTMGATAEQGDDAYDNEKPTHEVTLSDFAIGQTEVTQELWVAVMGDNPSYFNGYGNSDYGSEHSRFDYGTNLQRPVEQVSWEDCQTFIAKLNELTGQTFRLLTEAEWEYAARGGQLSKGHKYVGSDDIDEVAWYWDDLPSQNEGSASYGTQSVGTKAPNELGLYDMSGNVYEWCADWWGSYTPKSVTDPTGPESGSARVLRGGSWYNGARYSRVSYRYYHTSTYRNGDLGLRLGLTPQHVTTYTVNDVKFAMVSVEGGTFTMGATAEQGTSVYSSEKPAHEVTLSDFAIGQTEVTQELWEAVMGSNPSFFNGYGNTDGDSYHSDYDYGTNLQRPVDWVSWEDCQTFIAKLNELTGQTFRLPTEAEWEYAARGGQLSEVHMYAGSDDIDEVAWYSENIPSQTWDAAGYGTQPVATKLPNELGLYDMSGNVWEWCADGYGDYTSEAVTNPTGSPSGLNRVVRGGSWENLAWFCRVSFRFSYTPTLQYNFLGLRLAQ